MVLVCIWAAQRFIVNFDIALDWVFSFCSCFKVGKFGSERAGGRSGARIRGSNGTEGLKSLYESCP